MINKLKLKKKIIYRSTHRGIKEMDLLLGSFVKKNLDKLSDIDLSDLENFLGLDDEVISKWYFENKSDKAIQNTKISKMVKNFKI